MSLEMYKSALDWLGRGYQLLPCQPCTKKLVAGCGPYQKRIIDQSQAITWFRDGRCNLAVLAPDSDFILDFDDWNLYCQWVGFVKRFDDRISRSYTELTPRGAHVFLRGVVPGGFQTVKGVEVKRFCVVAPSVVGSACFQRYEVLHDGDIYSGSMDAALYPIRLFPSSFDRPSRVPVGASLLDYVKAHVSVESLFRKSFPKVSLSGRGKFLSGLCPFHDDKQASFFINLEKNLFGCHACKARGDVINFYALVNHVDNGQAIKALMAVLDGG